jgi:glycosyltransferase involved in cell wall biosynthesis
LRIGVFNPVLHNIGGAEYVTIVLINALREQGHQVILMSNKAIDPARTAFFFGKNMVVDAYISPLLDSSRWMPHVHPLADYVNASESLVLRLNCQILIDTYSDFILPWNDVTYFQERERNLSLKRPLTISSFFYVPFFKSSGVKEKIVLVVSGFLADFLEKKGIHCDVLYLPINVSYFSHDNKNFYGIKQDVVVTLSRFSEEKKLEEIPLIAKQTDRGVSFAIAGSCHSNSAYRVFESLQRLIKKTGVEDRVKLFPNISREKVRELLWNSKVYLHTRENEPFGITIVEAMSAGCIPIVHDSGGPREFVPEDLRYANTEEAVRMVEKSISQWSIERSEQMSIIASKFSEKEFSKKFLKILKPYIDSTYRK